MTLLPPLAVLVNFRHLKKLAIFRCVLLIQISTSEIDFIVLFLLLVISNKWVFVLSIYYL